MRVVVAIDSFKGSLSSLEAGEAIDTGIHAADVGAEVVVSPLGDGGEGTVDAIVAATGGRKCTVRVCGPLGNPVEAAYGILPGGRAVMEMAAAAGITLMGAEERDPLAATTYGVGEMIVDAIKNGCRRFLFGIGGSATNDGGVGMLQALGFSFLDAQGREIPRGARGLASLAEIRTAGALPQLAECEFSVACDVKNPLCGEQGCSAIYGPQKGATPAMVAAMDADLAHYAALTRAVIPQADAGYPGAGAAGGMGFALLAYLGGRLASGIDLVIDATGLEEKIRQADLVMTGEGRLDAQSCMGKAPVGVARLAKKYGKPVVALAGCVTAEAVACNAQGIDAFFPILPAPCTLTEAMAPENAKSNLARTAEQVYRLATAFAFRK
ncbi:MAG: glycerate kinase [Clostridia bacterium]|nr:glycerate kinase [Clostridia bacterium]